MYTAGASKEYVRNSVFLFFQNCKSVLTLPNLYFDLEKMFLNDGKWVECVEYKRDIYEKQKKIAPAGVHLHYSDVKYMDVTQFDGVFLDLCGHFGESAAIVLTNIEKDTKIAITLLLKRERKALSEILDLKNREESYVRIFAHYGIEITEYINYCDSSPMCVFFGIKK